MREELPPRMSAAASCLPPPTTADLFECVTKLRTSTPSDRMTDEKTTARVVSQLDFRSRPKVDLMRRRSPSGESRD